MSKDIRAFAGVRDAFHAWLHTVLYSLQTRALEAPFRPRLAIEHRPEGGLQMTWLQEPDLPLLAMRELSAMERVPEYMALLEAISSVKWVADSLLVDAAGQPFRDDGQASIFMSFVGYPCLARYIEIADGPTLTAGAFERWAAEIEAYCRADSLDWVYEAPLQGVAESSADLLKLSDDTWIRRRTDDDIRRVVGGGYGFDSFRHIEVTSASHIFVGRFQQAKFGASIIPSMEELVWPALTVLRLYREDALGINSYIVRPEEWLPRPFGTQMSPGGVFRPRIATYVALKEDELPLQNLLSRYKSMPSTNVWQIAVRRFNQAFERAQLEDCLIDYWVGLEALLLPEKDELGFRAALRVSKFIGDSRAERLRLHQFVKKSYNYRSSVVHGQLPGNDLAKVTDETGNILRRVLRRWLDSSYAHDVKKIDLSLLD